MALVEDLRKFQDMKPLEVMPVSVRIRVKDAADEIERLRKTLAWYGEQARLAKLVHSEGDIGRQSLAVDGGRRAKAALNTDGEGQGDG